VSSKYWYHNQEPIL